ncbi:MAG: ORF6N domain-containing protein [Deltaproteobacteria bacterium]|nr:ORF6N domain-containing protein [Candidatus Tharpella sp.]
MSDDLIVIDNSEIQRKILTIRGLQVMFDSDLAELYNVEIRVLNQAVKRNIARFPEQFRFQLSKDEFEAHGESLRFPFGTLNDEENLKCQIGTSNDESLRSQNATLKDVQNLKSQFATSSTESLRSQNVILDTGRGKHRKYLPYVFIADLIKSAKTSIVLIDNYVDETVLTLLSKRAANCTAIIYTKTITKKLKLDLKKHNGQYPSITIKTFNDAHDRFLLLDDEEIYYIGASLKDLGKKWFAFSKFDKGALDVLGRLGDE